ncbi:MAG: MarR family winged helix-turn-helix transcriptional regulator [Deltaproteobacteria bacterium]|jgi:DNA-binding MarR family transcriptional regulator|nr:MarR family winged helix-turn-helix transcriptional regulator [Deltaproteobacteria bacterium]
MPTAEQKAQPCCCIHLRSAARAVTGLYDAAIEASGLRITQFATLKTLHRLGPTCLNDLAEAMRLDRTTLVRNLELLKKQGLVEENRRAGGKARLVRITGQGEAKRREIEPLRDRAREKLHAALSEEERDTLHALLDKLQGLRED